MFYYIGNSITLFVRFTIM
uniref:Uncharacterized protein n=1 Tax=Rhizophora mucronata TaxID=61149 RepID=A0A2P2QK81_RHIMU